MNPPCRLAQSANRTTIASRTHQRGPALRREPDLTRQATAISATSSEKITTVNPAARGWITASRPGK